jgi:hypothetical protein
MVSAVSEQQEEKGTFEQISLALLMIRALDRRWTGTLIVEPASGERELLEFQRGLVCRVIVPDQYARLGQLLVDAKVVTTDELEAALKKDGLLGAALTEQSLIDEKTLQRALVLQLIKRTSRIFGLPRETKWTFSAGLELFEGMPDGVRIDSLRILWAGLSAHGEMGNWLDLTLNRIGESPFQVRQEVNLRRYGFTGDARRVVRLVRDERLTMAQIIAKGGAPEDVVKHIVYLLAITRYLDFAPMGGVDSAPPISSNTGVSAVADEPSISDESTADESSASEGPPSSGEQPEVKNPRRVARIKLRRVAVRPAAPDPPGSGEHRPPPARSSSEAITDPPSSERAATSSEDSTSPESADESPREQLSAEIKSRLGRLTRETPFTLLNVEPQAVAGKDDDELTDIFWTAYEECSRKWHPDNCPDDHTDLREGMAKIYDAMTEAFMSVTESEERHELIRLFAAEATEASELTSASDESGPTSSSGDDADAPSSGERPVDDPKLSPTELHAKALVALSEQRLDEALRLCRAACNAKPDEPDYRASSVWIRASMEEPDTKVLLLDLDGVLRTHPDHIQARFYRGVLRRRLGSDNAAKRDFERVLELQAGHAGAKAQLDALSRQKKKARK